MFYCLIYTNAKNKFAPINEENYLFWCTKTFCRNTWLGCAKNIKCVIISGSLREYYTRCDTVYSNATICKFYSVRSKTCQLNNLY